MQSTAFARLGNIWASKILSTEVKIRLYESLVLSILLYCAETWFMKKANEKKLEAAHHRWLRKILHILWKDMVSNEKVRELTGQQLLGDIIRERRLRWCGHAWRMRTDIPARAAISWFPTGHKRKRERPRIDWIYRQ